MATQWLCILADLVGRVRRGRHHGTCRLGEADAPAPTQEPSLPGMHPGDVHFLDLPGIGLRLVRKPGLGGDTPLAKHPPAADDGSRIRMAPGELVVRTRDGATRVLDRKDDFDGTAP